MTQHTAGPWKVSGLRADQDGCLSVVSAETGFDVAELAYTNGPEEADARLIAAAPDLLEALYSMLNCERAARLGCEVPEMEGFDYRYHFEKARAAIAKAGE